jgi:dimeric dUTPase (all-alpha-NTP-PPase superfamily)
MKELLQKQKQLDELVIETGRKDPTLLEKAVALSVEASELIDAAGYKWWVWSDNGREIDEKMVREEAIDVLHFLLSIFLSLGMDATAVKDEYTKKWRKNFQRIEDAISEKDQ